MSTTFTARQLIRRAASLVFAGESPINFAATGGDTTSIISTSANPRYSATTSYNGVTALVTEDAGGSAAAPEDEEHTITTFNGSNDWTASTFSAAIASGDEITFLYGLSGADALEGCNDIIRTLKLPRYLAASLVDDANMEDSGVTEWADVTGTPTQTKETTIVLTGTQSLKVVYTVLDTSVGSNNIPVTEGKQYIFWAPVKVTAGSCVLQVYDVTNAAAIDATGTIDEVDWTLGYFQFTAPADCHNVQVRIINKTASTTLYVDHVGVLSSEDNLLVLPSEISDAGNLDAIMSAFAAYASEATHAYRWGREFRPETLLDTHRDYHAVQSHRISIQRPLYPTFYEFRAAGSELTAMASTFYASTDLYEAIVEGVASMWLRKLAAGAHRRSDRQAAREMERRAVAHANTYHKLKESLGLTMRKAGWTPQGRVVARG